MGILAPSIFYLFVTVVFMSRVENPMEKHKGHLRPFGESGPNVPVASIDGFPNLDIFWKEYVLRSKPLVMKGAAKGSPAFEKWTDEYLKKMALRSKNNTRMVIETLKKERRDQPLKYMTLDRFLEVYNTTELYLVNDLPRFLANDFTLPCPLQCSEFRFKTFELILWFSSGGTASVIHTDDYENISCLLRGLKKFIFLDPSDSRHKVPLNPFSAASPLDVNRIDLTKNPGLAGATFHVAEMEAGDCLYIPIYWIHQVRSYGSNVAVNVWFKTAKGYKDGRCPNATCGTSMNPAQYNIKEWYKFSVTP